MKIAWFVNIVMPVLARDLGWWETSLGGWLTGQMEGIKQIGNELSIICADSNAHSIISRRIDGVDFFVVPQSKTEDLCDSIRNVLSIVNPDVFHIFGTETDASLAAINASDLDRTVVSIQGLVTVCAKHVGDGIPEKYYKKTLLKAMGKRLLHGSIIEEDAIRLQKQGEKETEIIRKSKHIIGRTEWDKCNVELINADADYHKCNEILRNSFYEGCWQVERCEKHTIFVSQSASPIKGFHQLLKAMPSVLNKYPDAHICVSGAPLSGLNKRNILKQWAVEYLCGYQGYIEKLVRENKLYGKIRFLNYLSESQMKNQMLKANVFVLPSNIENSPNSLCEAMLLGVPCVAADVGGVKDLLVSPEEGLIYDHSDVEKLSECINSIFASNELAERMSKACRKHALATHNPQKNTEDLLHVYRKIMG